MVTIVDTNPKSDLLENPVKEVEEEQQEQHQEEEVGSETTKSKTLRFNRSSYHPHPHHHHPPHSGSIQPIPTSPMTTTTTAYPHQGTIAPITSSKNSRTDMNASQVAEKDINEGYLRKRYSESMYMGPARYCIRCEDTLLWYYNKEHARRNYRLRGQVIATHVENWDGNGTLHSYPHSFALRTIEGRVLYCSATSEEEKNRWVHSFRKSIDMKNMQTMENQSILWTQPSLRNAAVEDEEYEELVEKMASSVQKRGRKLTVSQKDGGKSKQQAATADLDQMVKNGKVPVRQQSSVIPNDVVEDEVSETNRFHFHGKHNNPEDWKSDSAEERFSKSRYLSDSPHGSERIDGNSSSKGYMSDIDSVSMSSQRGSSVSKQCKECAVMFGTVRSRKVRCRSCDFYFCKKHCSLYAHLPQLGYHKMKRVCENCYRRQKFLTHLSLLSSFTSNLYQNGGLQSLLDHSASNISEFRKRLNAKQLSLLEVIKVMYRTRWNAKLFYEIWKKLPIFVETSIDELAEFWYQIVHLYQCCDSGFETSQLQQYYMKRFIRAVCRRSPRISLETIWHTQACFGDPPSAYSNSILSLLGFIYPPNSVSAELWQDLLIAGSPHHQQAAILHYVEQLYHSTEQLEPLEPESAIEKWLAASTSFEFEEAADALRRECEDDVEFVSHISYQSSCFKSQKNVQELVFEQVKFVASLADVSENMRHKTIPERKATLANELSNVNESLLPNTLYPLSLPSDNLCKVVRVPANEGKVFSTKMRAPTMIFLETIPVESASVDNSTMLLSFEMKKRRKSTPNSFSSMSDARQSVIPRGEHEFRKTRVNSARSTQSVNDSLCNGCSSDMDAKSKKYLIEQKDETREERRSVSFDHIVYRDVYGESWESKKSRIKEESSYGRIPGWNLNSIIVKTNDDLRQEVFAMQMISEFQKIFEKSKVKLWLRTYKILATGVNTGLVETITDACSLDQLKKHEEGCDLAQYFRKAYGEVDSWKFQNAHNNFIESMAAYSLLSYVLQVKDRHNGNILVSTEGHIIHIDFGFIMGIAPGGMFSLEDAPFKLTKEMVDVMGGIDSAGFEKFVSLLCSGMLALQSRFKDILALVESTVSNSPFPCFEYAEASKVLRDLEFRLCVGLSGVEVEKFIRHLVAKSYNAWGTRKYDSFQYRSNNIYF